MNEYDERLVEVAERHVDLVELARTLGAGGMVEHFSYTLRLGSEASPLLDGQLRSGIIPLQSDSWFVLEYLSSCVIRPDSPYWFTDSGNIKLRIIDTGAGEVLQSQPLSAGVLTATINRPQTGIPLLLPIPRIIPPNTNISVEATQQGVNATDNQEPIGFWVFFGGSRISMV